MPAFQKLWEKYGQRGLVVVGVAIQDRDEDSLEFMKKIGVTYPVGPDATGQIALDYKITSLPSTYFIDGHGQITRRWFGAIDEGRLETYALELLR
jgi:peroxiredoxin